MDNVEPSGSDINDMFISPATIIFNITNDDVVVEDNETYLVTMIPSDPNVFVEERMTRIIIIDDDSKLNHIYIFFVCIFVNTG